METREGFSIDKKGTVGAERISDGVEVELKWGRIDDNDSEDLKDTLGIENGTWIDNGEDKKGTFFIYDIAGERYKVYQKDLND